VLAQAGVCFAVLLNFWIDIPGCGGACTAHLTIFVTRVRFPGLSGRGTEHEEGKRVDLGLPTHLYPFPCAPQAGLVGSQHLKPCSQAPAAAGV